ncbi:MAG: hypothetical protein IKI93_17310, partial [Clostridia bacterium]|nr:hypothetical protein [Clostridia bacterium]
TADWNICCTRWKSSVLQNRDADFTSPWKTVLKNQFHDILCGTICDESLMQVMEEYEEAGHELEQIRRQIAGGEGTAFNTLNFPVDGIRRHGDETVAYHAEGFAAAEEKTLTGEPIALPCTYENEFYRAELDARGFITLLTDKKSGAVLVDRPAVPFGSLQMQADNGDNWVEFEYPWEEDHVHYSVNVPDPYDRRTLPNHPNVQLAANGVGSAEAISFGEDGLQITQKGNLRYWISDVPFTVTITLRNTRPASPIVRNSPTIPNTSACVPPFRFFIRKSSGIRFRTESWNAEKGYSPYSGFWMPLPQKDTVWLCSTTVCRRTTVKTAS